MNGGLKISLSTLEKLVVLVPACVISFVTIMFGAGGLLYYFSSAASLAFCLLYLSFAVRGQEFVYIATLIWVLFSFTTLGVLFDLDNYSRSIVGEFMRLSAFVAIGLAAVCCSKMNSELFRGLMAWIALSHVPALLILVFVMGRVVEDTGRVFTENLDTASLSEVALGMAMAALLSERKSVMVFVISFGIVIIWYTQMRTAGVALVIALLNLFFLHPLFFKRGIQKFIWISFGIIPIILFIVLFSDEVVGVLSSVLLLDDQYRGVDSGFSGRFDNWADGWDLFIDNMFFGIGLQNNVMNYTHNGYILILGQLGILIGGFAVILLIWSMCRALKHREIFIFSVLVALCFFYIGQPRNINFQLFPLVGLFAVGRAFSFKSV